MAKPEDIIADDWLEQAVPRATGGLNLADQSELIGESFFTRYRNVIPYRGKVQRDTGFTSFLGTIRGNPRKLFQHITRAGVGYTLLITNDTVYLRNADEWQVVSNGTESAIDTATLESGDTVFDVDDATGMLATNYIGITRNDGTQFEGQILSVVGNTITLTSPYTGEDADVGNAVVLSVGLSGEDDDHVIALSIPWSDEMVFTNGQNAPQVFSPNTITVGNLGGLPASGDCICKSIALFDNSLLLLNTIEGGQQFPQRIRWSDRAAITVWTGGESGSIDLLAETHHIKHALSLGPYLFIYRTGTIYRGDAVNNATKRFTWERMIANDGIFSTGGVVDLGDKHLYCGKDNFYEYRGGYDKVPVGEQIREVFFGNESTLDKDKSHKLFMINLEQRREVLVMYQAVGADNPDKAYRYSYPFNSWGTRDFTVQFAGFGVSVEAGETRAWNTIEGTWANQSGQWNSSGLIGSNSSVYLCSATNQQVLEYDFLSSADNGVPIQATIDTKDFSYPGWICRLDHIEIKGTGTDIYIYYSTDGGNTWTIMEQYDIQERETSIPYLSLGTVPTTGRVGGKTTYERIRFRFESFNAFSIEWMKIRFIPDYEW